MVDELELFSWHAKLWKKRMGPGAGSSDADSRRSSNREGQSSLAAAVQSSRRRAQTGTERGIYKALTCMHSQHAQDSGPSNFDDTIFPGAVVALSQYEAFLPRRD